MIHEASRVFARDWFIPNVTYRMTSLWTWFATDRLEGRKYQLLIFPASTFAADPSLRRLLADAMVLGAQIPGWLDSTDSSELNGAVVLVTSHLVNYSAGKHIYAPFVHTIGVAKFDVDDASWHTQKMQHKDARKKALLMEEGS